MEQVEGSVSVSEVSAPVSAPEERSADVSVGKSERDNTEVKTEPDKAKSLRSKIQENFKADKPIRAKTSASMDGGSAAVHSTPAPSIDPILAPADMRKEERELFSKADPALQAYLSRRAHEFRNDYTQKTMQLAHERRELQGINETVNQHRERYARKGIKVEDVVRRSLAWDQAFETDKVQAAKEYLAAYGLDPEDLIGLDGDQPQQQQQFNPQDIESMVEERLNQRFERIQQETSTRNMFEDVEKFKQSKPLFKDPGTGAQLERAMVPLVQGFRAADPSASNAEILDRAYRYVTSAEPQFAELNKRFDGTAGAHKTQAEAQRAIQASRSISGAPGGSTPVKKIKDLRANVRARLRGEM